MIKAVEEGDVNALKDIVEVNPTCISARFEYEYTIAVGTVEVSSLYNSHKG